MNEVGRPKKYKTAEEMQSVIDEYFKTCDEKGKPYTVSGLGNALDMTRQSILNYAEDEKFFDTIKRAKSKIEQFAEELLFVGNNTAGVIFNLKNNYNWKDRQEIEADINSDVTINIELTDD